MYVLYVDSKRDTYILYTAGQRQGMGGRARARVGRVG